MNLFIGKRIRELRRKEMLTQQDLADLTNLSLSSIKSYENSLREPNSKAMAALENYFSVSGAYLRGESDERWTDYVWDNPELMASIKVGTPIVLQAILNAAQKYPDKEQKIINNILIELRHTLTCSIVDSTQKSAGMELLAETIWTTNRFIDACAFAESNPHDTSNRILKLRKSCVQEYANLLLDFQNDIIKDS